MSELSANLTPLILASAVLPLQTILTLWLVSRSKASALAWVAGLTTVRLLQGILFGFVFTVGARHSGQAEPQFVLGGILLVTALLLYAKAAREFLGAGDEDAPPPAWLQKAGVMSPAAAFGAGAAVMAFSVKFLVFTLGAINAIEKAHLGLARSVLMFCLFVVLAAFGPLSILALALSSSGRSNARLKSINAWLMDRRRIITIVFGLVFGTWFLIKALRQLQVITAAWH